MQSITNKSKLAKAVANHEDKRLAKILKNLQILHRSPDYTNNDINKIIQDMELPLGMHLFITGKFSDLMDLDYSRVK